MLAKKENQQASTEAPALDTGKVLAMVKGIGRVNQTGNRDWIEDRLLNTILETGALELNHIRQRTSPGKLLKIMRMVLSQSLRAMAHKKPNNILLSY